MTIFPQYEEQLRELARRQPEQASHGRSRWRRPRAALALGVPSVVAVAVIAVALVLSGHHAAPGTAPASQAPPSTTSTATGPPPAWLTRLESRFPVLAHAPTGPPPPATGLSTEFRNAPSNLSRTRRIELPQGTIWIAPGRKSICIALARPGKVRSPISAQCLPRATVEQHGIDVEMGDSIHPLQPSGPGNPDRVLVGGIVPVGTSAVRIREASGRVVFASAPDNAYAALVPGGSVTLQPVPDPSSPPAGG